MYKFYFNDFWADFILTTIKSLFIQEYVFSSCGQNGADSSCKMVIANGKISLARLFDLLA